MLRRGYLSALGSIHVKEDYDTSTWEQLFHWELGPWYTSRRGWKTTRRREGAPERWTSDRTVALDNSAYSHWGPFEEPCRAPLRSVPPRLLSNRDFIHRHQPLVDWVLPLGVISRPLYFSDALLTSRAIPLHVEKALRPTSGGPWGGR